MAKEKKQKPAIVIAEVKEQKFNKKEILQADEFRRVERDFLSVYLQDGAQYTVNEARELLNNKLKGVVK